MEKENKGFQGAIKTQGINVKKEIFNKIKKIMEIQEVYRNYKASAYIINNKITFYLSICKGIVMIYI